MSGGAATRAARTRLAETALAGVGLATGLALASPAPAVGQGPDTLQAVGDTLAPQPPASRPPVLLEGIYTGEVFGSVAGGIRRDATYLDNLDLKAHFDAEQLLGWSGATFFVYVLSNRGGDPSDFVGDAQVVSNISAPNAWRLYEIWLQQNLLAGRLSLLAGKYDLNTEFDVIQSAGLFFNSSFGIGADFSQSGENGPSIFPVTSLGLRVKVKPRADLYLAAALLDGVPGDPSDPTATSISLSAEEGALIAAEVAYLPGAEDRPLPLTARTAARTRSRQIGRGQSFVRYDGKYALGGWLYTSRFDDLVEVDDEGEPVRRSGSYGIYALAERTVFREANQTEGLTVFGRIGLAWPRVNRFSAFLSSGAVYAGLLTHRPDDEIGLGVAAAINGSAYQDALDQEGIATDGAEVVIETTYRLQLLSWLAIQPDVQWVIRPDTDPQIGNAFTLALRGEAAFRWP